MRHRLRELEAKVAQLDKDWSPVINVALGELAEVRRHLTNESQDRFTDLARRMYDVERLLETTADDVDELKIKTEGRPVRLTRAPKALEG